MKYYLTLLYTAALLGFVLSAHADINGYNFKKQITIDASQVAGNLTNFPMVLSVTDADLRNVANAGRVENTNGFDIIFTADDELTILNHQVESYDPATGNYVAWIQFLASVPQATRIL